MRKRKFGHVVAATMLAVVASVVVLEALVRAWVPAVPFTEPARDVLFLEPDRNVGWKHPRDFAFLWKGRNPYCIEFRVDVTTNSFGFRDRARVLAKPPGTVRIAVLGDSFIEGIQVRLEDTATAQLERRLAEQFPGRDIEVMNFGVSNYGVGQYLLLYNHYVRAFAPDYVVVFASYLNFSRTLQRELSSRLQAFYALNVRPSFTVDSSGKLVVVPAADYERYADQVARLLTNEFGADRAREVAPVPTPLALPHWTLHVLSRTARPSRSPQDEGEDFPDLDINYRILRELNDRTQADGATLVFADGFEYLERYGVVRGSGALVSRNAAFFRDLGAGYVDLSPALRAATTNPQFDCDMHFNAVGHQAVADTLFPWFSAAIEARSPIMGARHR
jgi:hypothetical protein